MKIELMEKGFDDAINDIRDYLELALSTKDKKKKDLMISHARGIADAIYVMVTIREEDEEKEKEEYDYATRDTTTDSNE